MNALRRNPVYFAAERCESNHDPVVDPDSARRVQLPELGHYVIEIASSARPLSAHNVAHVDLFDLYHLYSDTVLEERGQREVLRLGFFSGASIAKTVARYLSMYFDSPRVIHLSAAEVRRSASRRFRPGRCRIRRDPAETRRSASRA